MRRILVITLCSAISAPVLAGAQEVPPAPVEISTPLAEDAPTAGDPAPVAGVTVEPKKKQKIITRKRVGGTVGGVVGGIAGAALLGPVGKFAGSFVGKTVAKGVMGDKKDKSEPAEAPQTAAAPPSAETAAAPVSAEAPVQTLAAEPPRVTLPAPEPVTVVETAPLDEPEAVAAENEAPMADAPAPN